MNTTKFGATSTTDDVIKEIDLTGRRAVVTGATSGLGIETARALAAAGAEVTLAIRDPGAGAVAARKITETTGNRRVHTAPLDLADLGSVAAFTEGWNGPLHILVNNAGVMGTPESRTPAGWELQFAVNHVGHFALATRLHAALASAEDARVVSVSSSGHLVSPVVFSDIHFRERDYDPFSAYGQSCTANILFAVEAARRWAVDGIAVNALAPGAIRTGIQRHVDEAVLEAMSSMRNDWKTIEQGAATSVLLAASPVVSGISGRYFEDCAEARPNIPGTFNGVAEYALDPEAADRLWQLDVDLIRT